MLVGDIADDHFDQVFHRDQSVGAAVFVDDQRKMNARRLHLGEQIEHGHGRRRIEDFANDLRRRQWHRQIDIAEVETGLLRCFARRSNHGTVRGPRRHERNQVADMNHAGRIIERVVVDYEPRMGGDLENANQLADGDVLLHGDDIGARHHDALDPAFAQPQNILEHGRFFRRETGLRLLGGENVFEVGARRRGFPAEQDAHDARQPAFLRLVGLRHDHRQTAMFAVGRVAARRGLGHGCRLGSGLWLQT